MKRQSRAERLAAGWTEHFGVYDIDGNLWLCEDGTWLESPVKRRSRQLAGTLLSAMSYERCIVRRFWRRKRSAAPNPLAVGDEVTVRVTVKDVVAMRPGLNVQILTREGHSTWVSREDVQRVNGGSK